MAIRITGLKELREQRGLTQQQLADLSGIRRVRISDLERGAWQGNFAVLDALATALDTDARLLIQHDRTTRRSKPKR